MIRRAFPLALLAAWVLFTHAPALAAVAAPLPDACCCTDSCPAVPASPPARGSCGCAVLCTLLPAAALPGHAEFWSGPGTSRGLSMPMDAVAPEARRAKPLLPPPKCPA